MKDRIGALEGLRGWAAMLVVIYHLPKWHDLLDVPLINNGHLMVPLFFVLSGFVIYSTYNRRINNFSDLLSFQFLRFFRVYPVHFILLAVYLIIECIRWIAVTQVSMKDVRLPPFGQNSMTALIQQLLLVQAIGPTGNAQTFNGPAWSISVEFYTYLLFGVLVLISGRRIAWATVGIFLISAILLQYHTGFENLLTCLVGFSLGGLVSEVGRLHRLRLPSFIATFVLCLFAVYLSASSEPRLDIVFALAALLVMALAFGDSGIAHKALSQSTSMALGVLSYSLYMCHSLVLWIGATIVKRGLGQKEVLRSDGKWVLQLGGVEAAAVSFFVLMASLATAWLILRYVERPAREWSRRHLGVRPILAMDPAQSVSPPR